MDKEIVVYQNEEGAIDLKIDASTEMIWASQKQLSELYGVDVRTVNEHLSNIFRTSELDEDAVIRKFRITASDGKLYNTKHYNLDAIISVGYRINSKNATKFRKWATTTLKSYITDGFVINPDRIERNKNLFLQSLEDLKLLAASSEQVGSSQAVDLVAQFAKTWFSLDAYDRADLPEAGGLKRSIEISAKDLEVALHTLRSKLISKGEATELFAQEKYVGSLEGLFGNVFQSYDGEDVYQTLEEKAAHLLYFVVKNHIFNDGNKRSGAYAFVWFLKEAGILNTSEISNQALTAITLLIAESDPKQKDKMIGLVLLMLGVSK